MRTEDLKTLAEMGRALWVDPRESQIATLETLSAVSLLDLAPDRALERAAAALLERVMSRGLAANTRSNLMAGAGLAQPFFRLLPEERFLLVALHLGRWSYSRLSRIFQSEPEEIEVMAWKARTQLASLAPEMRYPAGAPAGGLHCPEYDAERPWTQRFLDEEIPTGRERIFLQNHLMVCGSCRQALSRCREVYYAIDRLLPRLSEEAGDMQVLKSLERISRQSLGIKAPAERTFIEGVVALLRKRDVQLVLGAVVLGLVWKLLKL